MRTFLFIGLCLTAPLLGCDRNGGGGSSCLGDVDCNEGFACVSSTCVSLSAGTSGRGSSTAGSTTTGGAAGGTTGGGQCTDTWTNFASNFFSTYCTPCHSSSFGSSYSAAVSDTSNIQSNLNNGSMPPSGSTQPSNAEVNRILAWISCGTPQ